MKIKKVLAMLLVVAMAGSILAGCSSNSGETKKETKAETQAETNKETAGETKAADETTAETKAETEASDGKFNPDNEDGVSIADIRSEFGAVPVESGKTFGVVAKAFQNEFWRIFKEGYEAGAKYISDQGLDITVDVQAPTGETDEMGQLAIVNNMINQGYDALLLSPISDANLTPAVETAAENNIPVTNVNDGLIASAPYFVGPRAYENGELAAEWVSTNLAAKAKLQSLSVCLNHSQLLREQQALKTGVQPMRQESTSLQHRTQTGIEIKQKNLQTHGSNSILT